MKVISLASGSSGNCLYVESVRNKVLVDAGVSLNYIEKALASFGCHLKDISGFFLTHAHSDHAAYAQDLLNLNIPCFLTEPTAAALHVTAQKNANLISSNESFFFADLQVKSFPLSHDCLAPVGFVFSDAHLKTVAVATDLGKVTPEVLEALKAATIIVLEANHDLKLLHSGPYPLALKRRIASHLGHLSNKMAGFALAAAASGKEQKVLLAHLSQENNHPDLALKTVKTILNQFAIDSLKLAIAPRLHPLILN